MKNCSYFLFLFQVGIEMVPRDYDMNSPDPFRKIDIVGLVPVHKVMQYTVLLGRILCIPFYFAINKLVSAP